MGQRVEWPAVVAEVDLEAPLFHGEPNLDPTRSRGALGIARLDRIRGETPGGAGGRQKNRRRRGNPRTAEPCHFSATPKITDTEQW